jgi:site-specific DNA-adenine methylase
MRYLGGKHKIGEKIMAVMLKHCLNKTVDGYLEPFCGSLGVFKHATDKGFKKCIAADAQPDLIELWKQLQKGRFRIPETFSKEEYERLKNAPSPSAKKAMAAFFLSFGGKYFGGYAQKENDPHKKNYLQTFKNGVAKMTPRIQKDGVSFVHRFYLDWTPENMLIYCDPPYAGTEGYSGTRSSFDTDLFWETMRKWSKNNRVFVSEQTAPADFKSVWSHLKKRTLSNRLNDRSLKKEHLFVYSPSSFSQKTSNKTQRTVVKRSDQRKNTKTRKN